MLSVGTLPGRSALRWETCASMPACPPNGSSTWPRSDWPAVCDGVWGNPIVAKRPHWRLTWRQHGRLGRASGGSRLKCRGMVSQTLVEEL
jgi:hypothetical protein